MWMVGELGNSFGLLLDWECWHVKGHREELTARLIQTSGHCGAQCGGQRIASGFASPYEANRMEFKDLMQLQHPCGEWRFLSFSHCLRKAGNAPFCASEISRSYMTCLPQLQHKASQTDPTICSHLLLLAFFASFLSSGSVKAFPIGQQSVLNPDG